MSTDSDQQASEENSLAEDLQAGLEEAKEATAVAEEQLEETAEATETAEVAEEAPPELPPLEAPQMWSKEHREIFNQWGELENGRAYQEAMSELYGGIQGHITRTEQRAAELNRATQSWDSIFEPLNNDLRMMGTNPQALTNQLVGYWQTIQQDPAGGIQRLAQDFGVDIGQLVQDQPYVPEELRAVQREIEQLRNERTLMEQQARRDDEAQVMHSIEAFANEVDESGNLKHPYLQDVEQEMAHLIYSHTMMNGQRPSFGELEGIYGKACKLNDQVSAHAQSQKEAEKAARKAAEAKKATNAAARPKGKHAGTEKPPKDLGEHLAQKIAQANAA